MRQVRVVSEIIGNPEALFMATCGGAGVVYATGWMNYFGIGMRYSDIVELDHWLRRRIRI